MELTAASPALFGSGAAKLGVVGVVAAAAHLER